jgi:ABC-type transport system involved in cytochrome c biogenesis permease component
MSSVRRFATGIILAICIGAPVLEMFDQWDRTLQDGNDTEINLVIVALCVGAAFAVAGAIIACVRSSAHAGGALVPVLASLIAPVLTVAAPLPNSSPPTALRI